MAPHESVETDQHARDIAGQHAQRVFPAPVDVPEFLDPFEDHAAAAGGNQRDQAAGQRAGHSRRQRHPPGNVGNRHQDREQPGKEGPNGIARGMRHAGIKRADRQFAGVLQGQIRSQRQKIPDENKQRGDAKRKPVNQAEQGRDDGFGERGNRLGWSRLALLFRRLQFLSTHRFRFDSFVRHCGEATILEWECPLFVHSKVPGATAF